MILTISEPVPVKLKTVSQVAKSLCVSAQRVRQLLAAGRIPGTKNPDTGAWQIPYPFSIRPGERGPRFRTRLRVLEAGKRGKSVPLCTKTVAAATL